MPIFLSLISDTRVLLGIFVVTCGLYIWYLRSSNEDLTTQNNKLQTSLDDQTKAMESLRKDLVKVETAKKDLEKVKIALEDSQKETEKKIFRENQKKKSIEVLARKKTSLVEKKVNDATAKVFECFEAVSQDKPC